MMTVKELATYLNINEKKVYSLVGQGRIPGTRVTGKWTFPRSVIREWMESRAWDSVTQGNAAEVHRRRGGLILAGSDDLLIHALLRKVSADGRGVLFSFANLGSIAGLEALRNGAAHLASCHLLDPQTGSYNTAYVHRHLGDLEPVIVTVAHRRQGFVLPADKPDLVRDFRELPRDGVRFINRQKGSGTRLLVDHFLGAAGIDAARIQGYESEVHTHLEVGLAVLVGKADVGIATEAVADLLGLAFVPLAEERYDLVMPRDIFLEPAVVTLMNTLRSSIFHQEVGRFRGYDTRETGRIVV